jgi:hypothetical protein
MERCGSTRSSIIPNTSRRAAADARLPRLPLLPCEHPVHEGGGRSAPSASRGTARAWGDDGCERRSEAVAERSPGHRHRRWSGRRLRRPRHRLRPGEPGARHLPRRGGRGARRPRPEAALSRGQAAGGLAPGDAARGLADPDLGAQGPRHRPQPAQPLHLPQLPQGEGAALRVPQPARPVPHPHRVQRLPELGGRRARRAGALRAPGARRAAPPGRSRRAGRAPPGGGQERRHW